MAGLNTLFNNGNSIIYPGDIICADIPATAGKGARKNRALQTGVPREKLQFIVTPFRDLVDALGGAGAENESLAGRFIMGTALSYSRPGSSVDVVLHRCNTIVRNVAAMNGLFGEGKKPQGSKPVAAKVKKTKTKK